MRPGDKCWAHHPRGGFITGFCSKVYQGLGPERKIATTVENAKKMLGSSVPAHQVHPGDPPQPKEK